MSIPAAAEEQGESNVKSAAANLAESLIPGEVRPNTDLAESRRYLEKSDQILIQTGREETISRVPESYFV